MGYLQQYMGGDRAKRWVLRDLSLLGRTDFWILQPADGRLCGKKARADVTDAGVDAIVLDYTNYMADSEQIPYEADLRNILKVYLEILEEGGDVPQIVIMATWDYTQACKTVQYFYDQFYTDPLYERLWFRWRKAVIFGLDGYGLP